MLLQPIDTLSIQVVGRLIQEQNVRFLEQETAKSYSTLFSSRKCAHFLIIWRTTKRVHGSFELVVEFPTTHGLDLFSQHALTLDEFIHLIIAHRLPEFQVHLIIFFHDACQLGNGFHHYFLHGFVWVEIRFLLQITNGVSW